MLMKEAIDEFCDWRGFKVSGQTVVRYKGVLRIFCLCLNNPKIEDIRIEQVLHYMNMMQFLGWERNGILIVALALRKFFEYFNLRGFKCIQESLIPLPRKEYNLPRVASDTDFKRLLSAIPEDTNPNNIRNRALVNLIWDSWARSGEVVSLDEEDLVFRPDGSGTAVIRTEKSRGRRPIREIFWTPKTGQDIQRWIETKHRLEAEGSFDESGALFVSIRKCGRYDVRGKRMTNRGVCEVLRMISNRAALPTIFNAHSMRHYGGRDIIEQGGDLSDVANVLGHSHMDSSRIYTLLWGERLRKRYEMFRNKTRKITSDDLVMRFMEFIKQPGVQNELRQN